MNLSLYSGATGMQAQQLNLNVISNNIANVNTTGFKKNKIAEAKKSVSFESKAMKLD